MLRRNMVLSRLAQLSGQLLSAVLDPTIFLSFDRTGFLLHQTNFRADDLNVDLSEATCLVTGATSGLGRATATALARRGADTWLLCRDAARGAEARDEIRRITGNPRVQCELVDLARLDSVRAFATRFAAARVDVLVHAAAVLTETRRKTADGLELTVATNVVGPFLLTHTLLPKLRRAPRARVIHVATGGLFAERLEVDQLESHNGRFDGIAAYARTQRAQIVLAELWSERLNGTVVTVNSVHPGWTDTPAVRTSLPRFFQLVSPALRSPEEGADSIIWLAVCPRIVGESGQFWFDREPRRPLLAAWTEESPETRERLWALCCRLSRADTVAEDLCGCPDASGEG